MSSTPSLQHAKLSHCEVCLQARPSSAIGMLPAMSVSAWPKAVVPLLAANLKRCTHTKLKVVLFEVERTNNESKALDVNVGKLYAGVQYICMGALQKPASKCCTYRGRTAQRLEEWSAKGCLPQRSLEDSFNQTGCRVIFKPPDGCGYCRQIRRPLRETVEGELCSSRHAAVARWQRCYASNCSRRSAHSSLSLGVPSSQRPAKEEAAMSEHRWPAGGKTFRPAVSSPGTR